MPTWLTEIITSPLLFTWIGSICGHVLSLYAPEFKGTKPFLEKLIPQKTEKFYFRLDFLILPIIGALLGYVLLEPTNFKTSLFTGLSWSGALSAILKKSENGINKNTEE